MLRDVFIAMAGFVGGLISGAVVLMVAVAVRNAGGRRWRK